MLEQLKALTANPAILGGIIIVGSIIVAYLGEFLIRKTLVALVGKTKTDLDDKILDVLRKPIFLTVIFGGLALAAEALALPDRGKFFVYAGLETLAVIVWSMAAFRVTTLVLKMISRRAKKTSIVQPGTVPLFDMLIKVAVIAGALYFAFIAWHIDLTAWLASAGILGIAIGFAAKDTLANFFSGIFIVADAPYKLGDFIVIDGDLRGQVTHIGIRSTRLLTRDDIEITVPNALIANSQIINETGGPHVKQRVRIKVDAAYGSDIDKVREVLLQCPEGVDHVSSHPAPQVRFRYFGDSGLRFELLVWVQDPALRGLVLDVLNSKVYKAFNAAGIEIPYSKHDVYIKEMARQ